MSAYYATFSQIMQDLFDRYQNFKKSDQFVSALNTGSAACLIASGLYGKDHSQEPYKTLLSELPDLAEKVKRTLAMGARGISGGDKADECPVKKIDLSNCITFDDVVGLRDAKEAIDASIIKPLEKVSLWTLHREISKAGNILLYGLPGVGKTYLVKAALNTLQLKNPYIRVFFYGPTGGQLKGKYVGETEKNIEAVFKCASKEAKECEDLAPAGVRYISVVFLDEVDAIGLSRTEGKGGEHMADSVNALLQQLDGIGSFNNVFVIAATNYPWRLDAAVLRRFTEQIYIDLPKVHEKHQLFKNLLIQYWFKIKTLNETMIIKKPDPCAVPDCTKKQARDGALYNIWKLYDLDSNAIYDMILKKTVNFSNSDLNSAFTRLIRIVARRAELHGKFQRMTFQGHTYYVSTLNWNSIQHLQKTEGIHPNDGSPNAVSTKEFLSDDDTFLDIQSKVFVNVRSILTVHPGLASNLYEVFTESTYASNYAYKESGVFDMIIKFNSVVTDTITNLPRVIPIYFYIANWDVSYFYLKERWFDEKKYGKPYGTKYSHLLPFMMSQVSRCFAEYNYKFYGVDANLNKNFFNSILDKSFAANIPIQGSPEDIIEDLFIKLGMFNQVTVQDVSSSVKRNTNNNAIKSRVSAMNKRMQNVDELLPQWQSFVNDRIITTDFKMDDILACFESQKVNVDDKIMKKFIEYSSKNKKK